MEHGIYIRELGNITNILLCSVIKTYLNGSCFHHFLSSCRSVRCCHMQNVIGCCPEQRPGTQLVINISVFNLWCWDMICRWRALPRFTLKDVTYSLSQKVLLAANLCSATTQKSKALNCTTIYTWNPQNRDCLKIQAAAPALRIWLSCINPKFWKTCDKSETQ